MKVCFSPVRANSTVAAEMESEIFFDRPFFLIYVVYEDGIYN